MLLYRVLTGEASLLVHRLGAIFLAVKVDVVPIRFL